MNLLMTANRALFDLYDFKHQPIMLGELLARANKGHLLNIDSNAKTVKGQKYGYITGILYLSPSNLLGPNLCPFASEGCKKACLNTAGRGQQYGVQRARAVKTLAYLMFPAVFVQSLDKDIKRLIRRADKLGVKSCVRLNGTSDLLWSVKHPELFDNATQFYDYTKSPVLLKARRPANYHLTYSYSDDPKSQTRASQALESGTNVAIVFRKVPKQHEGRPVVVGDESDLRFLDRPGVIVGLTAKGRAKQDTTGFVQ